LQTAVKVAIELDLRSDDVTRSYTEYLKLKGLEELSLLYTERKDDLHEFHRAYKLAVDEGVAPQQLIIAANHLRDIASLESRREVLKRDVEGLEYKSVEVYNTKKELERLSNEKRQCESLIARLKEGEGYQRVQKIAEGIAMKILTDNSLILNTAIRTVLETLTNDHNLRLLIERSLRYADYYQRTGNRLCHAKVLELSELMYDELLAKCVNNTMMSALNMT
jgi:hypothetical protein